MDRMDLTFGAGSPKLATQLKGQGLRVERGTVARYQRMADSVIMLAVHGMLTKSESERCYNRLGDAIMRGVLP